MSLEDYQEEEGLVRRAVARDEAAIREIISRNNQRLYRVARSMVRDDCEAEDVLQEAYMQAFGSLATFRGDALLSTWLTRIVVNQALQKLRRRIDVPVDDHQSATNEQANVIPFQLPGTADIDPEQAVAQKQITRLIENAIDDLPEEFRAVLAARILDDLSVEATAKLLGIKPQTVKTRLFRARRLIKKAISEKIDPLFEETFPFAGERCDRLTEAVIERWRKNC